MLSKRDQERSLAYRKCMVDNFVRQATEKHIDIIRRQGLFVLQEMNFPSSASFRYVRDGYAVIELLEKALGCKRNAYESEYCSKIINFFLDLTVKEPFMQSIAIKVQEGLFNISNKKLQCREPVHERDTGNIIIPSQKFGISSVPSKEDSAYFRDPSSFYPINDRGVPRGVCLIINQDFKRENSVIDVERCKQTFSRLNYIVKTYNNLDRCELLQALKLTRDSINNGTYVCDSFIAFICSHGGEKELTFGKGTISREKIVEHFLGLYCPDLINKPKLFFFQNCRGSIGAIPSDTDVAQFDKSGAGYNVEVDDVDDADNIGTSDRVKKRHETNPLLVDVLISYATLESFVSYRVGTTGSLYLHHLFGLLDNPTYSKESYHKILTRLRELVQQESTRILSECDFPELQQSGIQITEDRNTLTKDFCFNPYFGM